MGKGQKQSFFNKSKKVLMKIDLFGESADFSINNERTYRSNCGAALSFVIILIVLIYGAQRFRVMLERGDTLF